jgi:hypothetical protein
MLRCTAKVLALLGVSEPAIGEACARDWYAHLVWIDRRKCLLVTHAGTLFSVFMPNVTAAGLRPIGPPVVSAIQAALQAEGLPVDTLGDLDPQQVAVAKTADRRILGTINDLVFTTEHVIATAGGLARCDIDALHHGLHRTINSITGYIPPIGGVGSGRKMSPAKRHGGVTDSDPLLRRTGVATRGRYAVAEMGSAGSVS